MVMFNLAGYRPIERLDRTTRTRVDRAIPTADGQPVAIQVRQNPHRHFHECVDFGNPDLKGTFDLFKRDLPFSARVEALPNLRQQRLTQRGARVPPGEGSTLGLESVRKILPKHPGSNDFYNPFAHFSGRIFTPIT